MVICFHGFIGKTYGTALDHSVGKSSVAGEMEVGKYQLVFVDEGIFLSNWFLYLDYHFSFSVNTLNVGKDFCSNLYILFISKTAVFASSVLYYYFMTMKNELSYSSRGHSHAVLIILDFFWNTYFHDIWF